MNCKVCSNKLTGQQRSFCSQSCKNRDFKAKAKERYQSDIVEKKCALETCDIIFETTKNRKYCSIRCGSKARSATKHLSIKRQQASYKKDNKSIYGRSYRYIKDYAAIDSGYF